MFSLPMAAKKGIYTGKEKGGGKGRVCFFPPFSSPFPRRGNEAATKRGRKKKQKERRREVGFLKNYRILFPQCVVWENGMRR